MPWRLRSVWESAIPARHTARTMNIPVWPWIWRLDAEETRSFFARVKRSLILVGNQNRSRRIQESKPASRHMPCAVWSKVRIVSSSWDTRSAIWTLLEPPSVSTVRHAHWIKKYRSYWIPLRLHCARSRNCLRKKTDIRRICLLRRSWQLSFAIQIP